ncbi:MAG: hypothetical protein ACPL3P_00040 [Anaerolineales bacterium]
MENSELDDTLPGKALSPTPQDGDELAQTQAAKIHADDLGVTQPSSVHASELNLSQENNTTTPSDALAATIPMKLEGSPVNQLSDTNPLQTDPSATPESQPNQQPKTRKPNSPVRLILIFGILALIGAALLSGVGGYASGMIARKHAEATQISLKTKEQFDLAMQDMASGNYERAKQRLEFVIKLDPSYPGVTDKMSEIILKTSITETPTVQPSPTVSPTPDMRGAQERLQQAQQQIYNSDWSGAIDTLLLLRKAEPDFQPAMVDDLLYLAYRNRGRDKILKEADLEGGIYDLTLAEKIGPLDAEVKGLQTWSRLYITGASFWDVDWGQVVYYFAQVAPAVPNLRDGSGWTSVDRYRIALGKYAEQLLARKDWCGAMQNYQIALSYGASDELQAGYNRAYDKCVGPQITPSEAPPPQEAPTETPTQ